MVPTSRRKSGWAPAPLACGGYARNIRPRGTEDETRRTRGASHHRWDSCRAQGQCPARHADPARAAMPAPRSRPARGTAAQAPATGRDACARTLCAAALGADVGRGGARPGRPPSRPRSRPRAAGTSGPRGLHRARAAQAWFSAPGGTCVRKARQAIGRIKRERVYASVERRQNGSTEPIVPPVSCNKSCRRRRLATGKRAGRSHRQGPDRATRTGLQTWVLRLPGVRPAGRVGHR